MLGYPCPDIALFVEVEAGGAHHRSAQQEGLLSPIVAPGGEMGEDGAAVPDARTAWRTTREGRPAGDPVRAGPPDDEPPDGGAGDVLNARGDDDLVGASADPAELRFALRQAGGPGPVQAVAQDGQVCGLGEVKPDTDIVLPQLHQVRDAVGVPAVAECLCVH